MASSEIGVSRDVNPLVRQALWLVAGTVGYNVLEAVVGFWAGVRAESIALVGFSLDSLVEIAAGLIVARRLLLQLRGGAGSRLIEAEKGAKRFVAVTFFALAAYILWQSLSRLISGSGAEESVVGIALAAASVTLMPLIAVAKLRVARDLGSKALEVEAKETLACAYLSLTLLLGLACTAIFNWWWSDAVAALAMIPWLLHEGKEGFESEGYGNDDEKPGDKND